MALDAKTKVRKINDSWYLLIPDEIHGDSQFPFDLEHQEEFGIRIDGKKVIIEK